MYEQNERRFESCGHMSTHFSSHPVTLSDEFLARLIAELDDKTVRAIILHGSYAPGDAVPPYSDIDLVRIVFETPKIHEHKRFLAVIATFLVSLLVHYQPIANGWRSLTKRFSPYLRYKKHAFFSIRMVPFVNSNKRRSTGNGRRSRKLQMRMRASCCLNKQRSC
jgi:hypothetical protein